MRDKVFDLIQLEEKRQRETLMMIPSENYTYPEVREALGSVLVHKYAEGQPGKRYYQGNKIVDEIELVCERRALEAFGLSADEWAVNVQGYSGTPANLAVYNALLVPGDKMMGMYLPDGGHLSHGWEYKGKKVTLSAKIWNVQFYKVDEKSRIFDYEVIEKQAVEFGPKLIISGGTAYPREIDHKRLGQIAKRVGAYYMADIAHEAGLVAAGVNSSPFLYADVVTMTTHKTLRGPRGALIFARKEFGEAIDASVFPGFQGGPHMHTIAGIAVALEKTKLLEFKEYAAQTVKNAKVLAECLAQGGFDVVSGGTDKHLVLVDLREMGVGGWFAGNALERAGIVVNQNTVPYETASPFYPSGVRLGTPAVTVRGMKEAEMKIIAEWMTRIVAHIGKRQLPDDKVERYKYLEGFKREIEKDDLLKEIAEEVKELCGRYDVF